MAKSNGSTWEKPYAGFPLSFHPPSGRLYRKINSKRYYFGYAADWQAAMKRYDREAPYRYRNEEPPPENDESPSLADLINLFLEKKEQLAERGRCSRRSFIDYESTGKRLAKMLGRDTKLSALRPSHFERIVLELSKTRTATGMNTEIVRMRAIFGYAYKIRLVEQDLPYRDFLVKPDKAEIRRAKAKRGPKDFSAAEVHQILRHCDATWRAFVLLAVNTGCGNADVGQMQFDHLDLDNRWLDYERPKTGTPRRARLWRCTVKAIRDAMASRPTPKAGYEQYVFLTRTGTPWFSDAMQNPISAEFRKILQRIDREDDTTIYRNGRGFNGMRHTFRRAADAVCDKVACDLAMGHCDNSMGANYRSGIFDSRLDAVAKEVRRWLRNK